MTLLINYKEKFSEAIFIINESSSIPLFFEFFYSMYESKQAIKHKIGYFNIK